MRRTAIAEAQNAKVTAKNCEELLKIGKEKGSPQLSSEGRLRAEQISPVMRNIVLASLGTFIVGCLICASGQSYPAFVLGRAVMGLGGAAFMTSGRVIV